MIYSVIIIYFLFLLVFLAAMVFMVLLLWAAFFTKVPFIPVDRKILPVIVSAMRLEKGGVVYDLGCGDGRVLAACSVSNPEAQYIGLDKDWLPIILAKWRTRHNKNIKILRQDFFRHNLAETTHIYMYLLPEMMDALLPKLEKELRSGTRLVACDYAFAKKQPVEIIDLNRANKKRGKRLLVYNF